MNKLIKDQWVAALRSGDYIQGHGELMNNDLASETTHCCLGVLTDLYIKEHNSSWSSVRNGSILPAKVAAWSGLDHFKKVLIGNNNEFLWRHNDVLRRSFNEIADAIEAQL